MSTTRRTASSFIILPPVTVTGLSPRVHRPPFRPAPRRARRSRPASRSPLAAPPAPRRALPRGRARYATGPVPPRVRPACPRPRAACPASLRSCRPASAPPSAASAPRECARSAQPEPRLPRPASWPPNAGNALRPPDRPHRMCARRFRSSPRASRVLRLGFGVAPGLGDDLAQFGQYRLDLVAIDGAGGAQALQLGQHRLVDQMRLGDARLMRLTQGLIVVAQLLVRLAQRLQIGVEPAQAVGLRAARGFQLGLTRLQPLVQRAHPLFKLGIGELFILEILPQLDQLGRIARLFAPLQPLGDPVQCCGDPRLQLVYLAHLLDPSLVLARVPDESHTGPVLFKSSQNCGKMRALWRKTPLRRPMTRRARLNFCAGLICSDHLLPLPKDARPVDIA